MIELVSLALRLAERSGGLFDPTVLRSLEAAGYDRSFEALVPGPGYRASRGNQWSWRDVHVDTKARTITMPEGCGIDIGGIGKGWAVDRMAAILGAPCLVNGGGDVLLRGTPPDQPAWTVGIADPFEPERDLAVLSIREGAVATSSSLKRSWRMGDLVLHHLIDPHTRRPSNSDAAQVTAVAATATLADYHAKVALLMGSQGGLAYLNQEPGVEGLIISSRRESLQSDGWEALLLR